MGLIAAILQSKMFFPLSSNNLFAYPIALLLAVYNSNKPFAAVLTFFDENHLARAGKSPNFAAENLKANRRGCDRFTQLWRSFHLTVTTATVPRYRCRAFA
jgi:hypothetical protein